MTVRELHGHAPATHTYSPDGELVSVTIAEPRFTPAEVGLLLAARRAQQEPRGAHGHLMTEATDPANQGRFVMSEPVTDFAQKAYEQGMEKARARYGDEMLKYLVLTVEKKS